jgi:splicing factor 3A subunit 3
MSSTQLELIRQLHELCEKSEVMVGEELDFKPSGQKPKVWQQHRLKQLLDGIVENNNTLDELYKDVDMTLQEELQLMSGSNMVSFYDALNASKQYYQSFPNSVQNDSIVVKVDVSFSGEEVFGKYLDLNELHLQFSNIICRAGIEQDYNQYLERFNKFFYLPSSVTQSKHFSEYLDNLWQYLLGFVKRVHPLNDWELYEIEIKEQFMKGHPSLTSQNNGEASKKVDPQPLRLGMFGSPQELEVLGLERLKEALEALGLKSGGTVQERAARLWLVRGKRPEDFPANLKSKTKTKPSSSLVEDMCNTVSCCCTVLFSCEID